MIQYILSFEVWMDVVDAKVDVEVKLKFSGCFIGVPKFDGVLEKLVSVAFFEVEEDGVFIWLVTVDRVDLSFSFEVGFLVFEGIV